MSEDQPMRPMLAVPTQTAPQGSDWVHEVKWDGMRVLADLSAGRLALRSRNGNDVTDRFPELAALADCLDDALLDGEIVAFDEGALSFGRLSDRIHVRDRATALLLAQANPVTFMVFDVLRLAGHDTIDLPWRDRRDLLTRIEWAGVSVFTPPTYDDAALLLQATIEQGLEGIVSKRRDSSYLPGRRSPLWLKHAHRPSRSVVVGGWRPVVGTDTTLGSLLVGLPGPGGLGFLGRVGSGLAGSAQLDLLPSLRDLACPSSPFDTELAREDSVGARWVRPELVVDVRALGSGARGRLRQPAYRGIRSDLDADSLRDGAAHDGRRLGPEADDLFEAVDD